ncbi:Membrane bound protein complex subunit mbxB [Rubrobacter xylanophilus DSM 9941]|uniref:Membrane bound protein complex subunit mbxB n=1 Tax=Rubrobacter xylanophilus (strain DSM 9941 / JCM 11954 / NBRC 16129 / PRD-1) TaxID=266117 RepID=Q1ARC8_RUBXD|nr:monovalent cation/H+ antiporter complex subunit F [Rubrobacter xylanophilus]ABG06050.1 Membrane bound protein complex subunit mbxB [Rubrobacter xylanophilus DSM 9941]
MHETVFYAASVWMALLLLASVYAVIRIPSATGRILALDTLTLVMVGILVLFVDAFRTPYFLDAALILALLAFVGTVAAARYHSERRVF